MLKAARCGEALGDLAQLKKGERVLIHAAAGGVGLVAIQHLAGVAVVVKTHGIPFWRRCTTIFRTYLSGG